MPTQERFQDFVSFIWALRGPMPHCLDHNVFMSRDDIPGASMTAGIHACNAHNLVWQDWKSKICHLTYVLLLWACDEKLFSCENKFYLDRDRYKFLVSVSFWRLKQFCFVCNPKSKLWGVFGQVSRSKQPDVSLFVIWVPWCRFCGLIFMVKTKHSTVVDHKYTYISIHI